MKRTSVLLITGLVVLVSADAQTPAPAPQQSGWESALKDVTDACKSETPKLCPGLSTDTAYACLQSNFEKLTPGCKDAVMKAGKSLLNF